MRGIRQFRRTFAVAFTVCFVLASGGGAAATLTGCADADYGTTTERGGGGGDNSGCCKICTVGKACGDTCISASYTCHVGAGCACDG